MTPISAWTMPATLGRRRNRRWVASTAAPAIHRPPPASSQALLAAGVLVLCGLPELPDPELPDLDPELPDPELPDPELPDPLSEPFLPPDGAFPDVFDEDEPESLDEEDEALSDEEPLLEDAATASAFFSAGLPSLSGLRLSFL